MGLMIKAAACCFLFFFAILQYSHVSAVADPVHPRKMMVATPSSLEAQAAAMAPTGVDCNAKCDERVADAPRDTRSFAKDLCVRCCLQSNKCVPPGPYKRNEEQCPNWNYVELGRLRFQCP